MDIFKVLSKRFISFAAALNSNGGDSSPQSGSYLFDLPQEIQDVIFEYAYPRVHDFRPIYKCVWDDKEISSRRTYGPGYIYRPFSPKVSSFLISKHYFLAAAQAFIGNQVITDADQHLSFDRRHNIIMQFMSEATIKLHALKYLLESRQVGPNLKKLTIEVSDYQLEIIKPKYPWEEEFNDYDYETIFEQSGLEHLRRLKEYRFTFSPSYYTKSQAQVDLWNFNMRRLEEYVRAHVSSANVCITDTQSQNGVAKLLGSIFSQKRMRSTRRGKQASTSQDRASGSEITLDQLPETADEMVALLKKDGEKVMRLIAQLKAEKQGQHNYLSSESTLVQR